VIHGYELQQLLLNSQWQNISILQPHSGVKCKLCLAGKQQARIKVGLCLISLPEVAEEDRDRAWLTLELCGVQLLKLPGSTDFC